jgi:hypothetical protein
MSARALPLAAFLFFPSHSYAQIKVSMDIMTSAGTAPQIGRGIAAYTLNIHVLGVGTTPVSFTAVRLKFPEVRIYSMDQGMDILATRVEHSAPVRVSKILGYGAAAFGIGVTMEQKIKNSPSWFGEGLTIGGLAVPVAQAMLARQVPSYQIRNPPPENIILAPGQGAEYTWLCARGSAPVTIPERTVDPIPADVSIKK